MSKCQWLERRNVFFFLFYSFLAVLRQGGTSADVLGFNIPPVLLTPLVIGQSTTGGYVCVKIKCTNVKHWGLLSPEQQKPPAPQQPPKKEPVADPPSVAKTPDTAVAKVAALPGVQTFFLY